MARLQLPDPHSGRDDKLLDGYFRQLSAGEINRREFEEATGNQGQSLRFSYNDSRASKDPFSKLFPVLSPWTGSEPSPSFFSNGPHRSRMVPLRNNNPRSVGNFPFSVCFGFRISTKFSMRPPHLYSNIEDVFRTIILVT